MPAFARFVFYAFGPLILTSSLNLSAPCPPRVQILYLPDISMIVSHMELRPGSVVLESGTGSGSLTTSLVRAVAPTGHVFSFEYHEQRANTARGEFEQNGLSGSVTVFVRDTMGTGFPEKFRGRADAVFLDLPGPQQVAKSAAASLRPNGRLCSFSPCIEQARGEKSNPSPPTAHSHSLHAPRMTRHTSLLKTAASGCISGAFCFPRVRSMPRVCARVSVRVSAQVQRTLAALAVEGMTDFRTIEVLDRRARADRISADRPCPRTVCTDRLRGVARSIALLCHSMLCTLVLSRQMRPRLFLTLLLPTLPSSYPTPTPSPPAGSTT